MSGDAQGPPQLRLSSGGLNPLPTTWNFTQNKSTVPLRRSTLSPFPTNPTPSKIDISVTVDRAASSAALPPCPSPPLPSLSYRGSALLAPSFLPASPPPPRRCRAREPLLSSEKSTLSLSLFTSVISSKLSARVPHHHTN